MTRADFQFYVTRAQVLFLLVLKSSDQNFNFLSAKVLAKCF